MAQTMSERKKEENAFVEFLYQFKVDTLKQSAYTTTLLSTVPFMLICIYIILFMPFRAVQRLRTVRQMYLLCFCCCCSFSRTSSFAAFRSFALNSV